MLMFGLCYGVIYLRTCLRCRLKKADIVPYHEGEEIYHIFLHPGHGAVPKIVALGIPFHPHVFSFK